MHAWCKEEERERGQKEEQQFLDFNVPLTAQHQLPPPDFQTG